MFRPIAAIFRLLQFCSTNIIYMPILRGDAEISLSLRVKISLFSGKSNGQRLVGCTFMGRYWGGLFGGTTFIFHGFTAEGSQPPPTG